MKKIVLFILLLSGVLFADELKGVFDIKFGEPAKTVYDKMINKGYRLLVTENTDDKKLNGEQEFGFLKEGGTYGNHPFSYIHFAFDNNNNLGEITIYGVPDFEYEDRYSDMLERLIKKYDLIFVNDFVVDNTSFYSYTDSQNNTVTFLLDHGNCVITYRSEKYEKYLKAKSDKEEEDAQKAFENDL